MERAWLALLDRNASVGIAMMFTLVQAPKLQYYLTSAISMPGHTKP